MGKAPKVHQRTPRRIPIDENKVCYLLLHAHVPSPEWPVLSVRSLEAVQSAKRAGKLLGVIIWPMRLVWSKNKRDYYRYFFRFPRYRRDDERAQHIAECFLHALAVIHGPCMDPEETACAFRIPVELVHKSKTVSWSELLKLEEARSYHDRTLDIPRKTLGTSFGTVGMRVDAAWKITPILMQYENLYRAACFLKASQDGFYVWPGQIRDVLEEPQKAAPTGFHQVQMETSLQNAFKSVEAVLGDPPKDNIKFFAKMKSIGLDPKEEVGYGRKVQLHNVVRVMNQARDRKAAHGSTPNRTITLPDLMEFQACAHYIVCAAIENQLGEEIYPETQ